MLKTNLLLAFRNFYKSKFYTTINVIGLTAGVTACLVIFLYIKFELSYDRFHANADRIVRMEWDLKLGETHDHKAAVTPPFAGAMVRDFPEVEAAARFRYMGSVRFRRDIENTLEWRVVYADNDIFQLFSIPFVAGDPLTALKEPNTLVMTEKSAEQFFPNENAVGKTLLMDNETLYTVTGVVKDLPENSHFKYRVFLSLEGLDESKAENWIGGPFNTYLLLRPDADYKVLESKLPKFLETYVMPNVASVFSAAFIENFKASGNSFKIHLRPLLDIHLYSNLENELGVNGDIAYVYLFGVIAIFILVIASINFVNLATARSIKRAREVGVRKVMGSGRIDLALQFIGESTILSITAFVLALVSTQLVLPIFNSEIGLSLSLPLGSLSFVAGVLLAAILLGILSGIYPGIVLSSFQPAKVLKGKVAGSGASNFQNTLVVFQFAISIFLVIVTMAVYKQMDFMQNKKLGFNQDQVVVLKDVNNLGDRLTVIRDEMVKSNLIENGTISSFFPGPGFTRKTPLLWKYGSEPLPENSFNSEFWTVDHDYVATMGMEILDGRNFSRDFPTDSSGVILNESAVKRLGLTTSPIGQKIAMLSENKDGSYDPNKLEAREIIGVVKDFNFESLKQNVEPLGLFFGTSQNVLALRYEAGDTREVIAELEKQWTKLAPGEPFHYTFMDENFQSMYHAERKAGKIFTLFSTLAMIIACLGLFALTAFTAEQRTKEIGIRKVMGASIQNVLLLLSGDFGKLILVGFALAVPAAVYSTRWFLQDYAYQTEISWWIYASAGLLTSILALLTIGYQSLMAAKSNPIVALRSE